ncbi:hypothetical protein RvY_11375-1 [Ramazzottius varieornatus]|uniref:Uncharacterized protein n=1 Tax=Ramazzottius varieornatus TaxID=947166 RepID=A0A1D1VNM7_RAMVA|nr:hypothetical protein RvY_11375-1 [Ramazzottius varieornatus]
METTNVVNFNSGQQQSQQQNIRHRPPSAPQKARTTSGSYPNQNSAPGGAGGYLPPGQQGMSNHQGPPPPQFMQNGQAFNPAMMPGMYSFPPQNPFVPGGVVMTMPMGGMPYYSPQQIPGQQMPQRMPQAMPMSYGTSPVQGGFYMPASALVAPQFNPNQPAFVPGPSGAPSQGYPSPQGSVSPNVPTGGAGQPGINAAPRFPVPDVVAQTTGAAPGTPSFAPRAPGVGPPVRPYWQTDPLFVPGQAPGRTPSVPVATKPLPERKKNVLVSTDPKSGSVVDIPKTDEKPKAAAVPADAGQVCASQKLHAPTHWFWG